MVLFTVIRQKWAKMVRKKLFNARALNSFGRNLKT
jgi:hypothetical protein